MNAKKHEEPEPNVMTMGHSKKPRLVFTDLQRRTLQAIFKVCFFQGCQGVVVSKILVSFYSFIFAGISNIFLKKKMSTNFINTN